MFGSAIGQAFLWSLIIVLPTLIALIGSRSVEAGLVAAVIVVLVLVVINTLIFWWAQPTIGMSTLGIYKPFWWLLGEFLVAAIIVGFFSSAENESPTTGCWILVAVFICAFMYGWHIHGVWTNGRAQQLAQEVKVQKEPISAYPDTDANHILQVPQETADFKAQQVLASSTEHNINTFFAVDGSALQSVNQHLYWVFWLKPTGYRNSNKAGGIVPGYVVVDAEDPDASAQMKVGARYSQRYVPGGVFGLKLKRHLWKNGYSGKVITDLTMEVDDNWKPHFTASIDRRTVGAKSTIPGAVLVVEPLSGETKEYSLKKSPDWIDRIYSEETVKTMLNWWGEWGKAPYNMISESSANRYKVADEEDPVLVYTKEGYPVWQVIMTSWNKDTSASYLALFDARKNRVRLYQIPGLTLASTAANTIHGNSSNTRKLEPVHLALHQIYGQLTWVASMITEGGGTSANQGVALLKATDINGENVVQAQDMGTALTNYRVKLARGFNNQTPSEQATSLSIDGTIVKLGQIVKDGQTIFYIRLESDKKHVYRASVASGDPELPFIETGHKVRLGYLDSGNVERDVGNFDDLGSNIAK